MTARDLLEESKRRQEQLEGDFYAIESLNEELIAALEHMNQEIGYQRAILDLEQHNLLK